MRVYLDEQLSDDIAALARTLGVDTISSHACGNDGPSDEAQLVFAAGQGHCIVTNDHTDFIDLAERWAREGRSHAGILLLAPSLPPNRYAAIARALAYYATLYPDGCRHLDWLHAAPDST